MKLSIWPILALIALVGCHGTGSPAPVAATAPDQAAKPGPDDPKAVAFLKSTMDAYKALKSYSAKSVWTASGEGSPAITQQRTLVYESPNKFRSESTLSNAKMVSVCDGTTLLEYSSIPDQPARTNQAPEDLSQAPTSFLTSPYACGTVLYQFFGGSGNYDQLVNSSKGNVTFGAEAEGPGEKTEEVKFYGPASYGHVVVTIGEKTHRVYKIAFDNEPAVLMISDPKKVDEVIETMRQSESSLKTQAEKDKFNAEVKLMEASKGKKLTLLTTEVYSDITQPTTIDKAEFVAHVPDGMPVNDMTATPLGPMKPPMDVGTTVPDFTVVGLDGKKLKISSLRGHPVMIDFWATWCPPCVASLPETNRIASVGAPSGLKVLAISGEEKDTVAAFIKEKQYTMPTYLDPGMSDEQLMKANALPSTIIIDPQGKLAAYIIGGGQEAAIHAALAKLGVRGL
jgi:thiol-disulfide isomerase/thioredoxin